MAAQPAPRPSSGRTARKSISARRATRIGRRRSRFRRDTLVQIYSMTKPVTGVALMQLWEQGKFGLDDKLSDYLPEFAQTPVFVDMDNAGQSDPAAAAPADPHPRRAPSHGGLRLWPGRELSREGLRQGRSAELRPRSVGIRPPARDRAIAVRARHQVALQRGVSMSRACWSRSCRARRSKLMSSSTSSIRWG